MNCPTCIDERLVMTDRSGIEIDYCPKCRGRRESLLGELFDF